MRARDWTTLEEGTVRHGYCSGCGVCIQVCPYKAISYADEKGLHISSMTLEQYAKGGGK